MQIIRKRIAYSNAWFTDDENMVTRLNTVISNITVYTNKAVYEILKKKRQNRAFTLLGEQQCYVKTATQRGKLSLRGKTLLCHAGIKRKLTSLTIKVNRWNTRL